MGEAIELNDALRLRMKHRSQGFSSAGVSPVVQRASCPPIGPAGGRRYQKLLQCLDWG